MEKGQGFSPREGRRTGGGGRTRQGDGDFSRPPWAPYQGNGVKTSRESCGWGFLGARRIPTCRCGSACLASPIQPRELLTRPAIKHGSRGGNA
jgi:hypothetical protein